ncbi:hypothetical protein GBAR_LOCUS13255 [Geodia barretti]|uniref:Uncharacterized protein n=1 Tax=Geodia barretti TaxID=519541 RepID=A0AA35WQ57_GEOBA|nr:hypothetical protein GBAR_LOCUS13255 [Geodia barretti]
MQRPSQAPPIQLPPAQSTPVVQLKKRGTTRSLDSTPSLRDLAVFKTRSGEKIEIIKSLAPEWKSFGVHLNFDDMGSQLSLIEAQHGPE